MSELRVVPLRREGWRDAAATLREIASQLESGELPPCSIGALAMMDEGGRVDIFGFGQKGDDLQCLALFRLGEQQLIESLLAED